jgi:hypothetical protein
VLTREMVFCALELAAQESRRSKDTNTHSSSSEFDLRDNSIWHNLVSACDFADTSRLNFGGTRAVRTFLRQRRGAGVRHA